ncbi:MAG: DUF2924 domain-containing protein [Chloroflexi bacterium]|nr:DUF2924 domain-containing protein [Chloroflexota bacterium]
MEIAIKGDIAQQIAQLGHMTVPQLRKKYAEVFGEESRSNNRQFLYRRIAWRIQALAEGGLSERARLRAMAIANDADLRIRAPKRRSDPNAFLEVTAKVPKPLDNRLPAPGTWLEREYRGQRIAVKVRADGFEFEGRVYKSLTAVANEATGGKWNGFKFFGLPTPSKASEVDGAQE